MRTTILAIGLVVAFVLGSTAVVSDHESSSCEVTSSEPDLELGGIAVFVDYLDPEQGVSVWVYQDSNDIDGIQRDDDVVQDELCGHDGDTVLF